MGLAISDPLGVAVRALPPLDASVGRRRVVAQLSAIASEHQVRQIIVGLPRNMDGSEGPSAASARRLAGDLQAYTPDIEVILHDERLTTAMAERTLIEADVSRARRRQLIDGQAAVVLLTSFLSARPGRDREIAATSARIGVNEMPNEDREDIVILTDDEGNEVEFLFLDAFEVSGRKYAVLVPLEGTDNEDEDKQEEYVEASEAMIFRLEKEGEGDEVFVEIEDDEEWAEVTAAWEDLQDEDFEDEEAGEDPDQDDDDDDDDDDDADKTPPVGGYHS